MRKEFQTDALPLNWYFRPRSAPLPGCFGDGKPCPVVISRAEGGALPAQAHSCPAGTVWMLLDRGLSWRQRGRPEEAAYSPSAFNRDRAGVREAAVMPERRDHTAGFLGLGRIDLGGHDRDLLAAIGQDLAPGRDDQ